ncbi:type II and III secretion system protein [Desulfovibrio sp. X2]|uniref:type II and III secretion system protein family protein n=1 Tax=Desulfovibrio sp. X2 TaxID=941449 RepID=UPI00035871BF|nr:type II and III secretion system protein family protein [Desulfovibrio sp. X2]EPR44148.1 type II and III secretion system protein [Desulfovibrio sp. X2]
MSTGRIILIALILVFLAGTEAHAVPADATGITPTRVDLTTGHSLVLNVPENVSRVALASPDIADVMLLSPRQIYLNAKKTGSTSLTVWVASGRVSAVYDLIVTPDVTPLKEMLHKILPEERGIHVMVAGDSVTLSGTASSAASLSSAVTLAEAYAPKKVVNLMRVGGVQQVMLEVRVAEMSRTLARRLGINLAYAFEGQLLHGQVFHTFLNQLTAFDKEGKFILSNDVDMAFTFKQGGAYWSAFIDALKENGVVKVLAEPNLVCLSGEKADFLAGGEIPIPIPQGLGTVAVQFKSFGVGLSFRPTVLGGKRISLEVNPEVSELDFSNAISISGVTIPAITTRRASTVVELDSGQSFAIAGLIKDSMREDVQRFPVLGDVPILGSLFRDSAFQKNESELVIIVTPHLVKPLDMAAQTLPTDGFKEPNDVEFYLFGDTQGGRFDLGLNSAPAVKGSGPESGFDGEFGHTLPQ